MGKKKGRVAIISRESNKKTIDVRMLEEELRRRGVKVQTLCKLLTKDKSIKSLGYIGHVIKQEAAILRADVVVLDTYCIPASMIPHGKGTKIIQMWHALAAIKKFGWQTVGKKDGSSEKTAKLMKMHKGYDYVIASSDITAEHFSEGFRTDRSKTVKQGLPRIDYIKSVSSGSLRSEIQNRIYGRYPSLEKSDKKLVLYAPTFRRNSDVSSDIAALADAINYDNYNLVVKLHPVYRGTDISDGYPNVIFDDDFKSFDWLSVADVIISDYSSLVVESTLADKPLYLYTFDIEEYIAGTGLNTAFSKEPIAPYVFKDPSDLAAELDKPYDMSKLHAFRDRYIDIDIGEGEGNYCTAKLADFIESVI